MRGGIAHSAAVAGFLPWLLWRKQSHILAELGPGLITGAADDDPSGIATYSQAGAQFGYGLGWSVLLSLPFMAAVQEISARMGRVTGHGLAEALRRYTPWPVLAFILSLLAIANVLNLAADLGAMGETVRLLIGGSGAAYTVVLALICVAAEIWMTYKRYVRLLKFLTLSLLSYFALLTVVHVDWRAVALGTLLPRMELTRDAALTLVTVLGTTISPYLFFWQAAEEAEDEAQETDPRPLRDHAGDAPAQLHRIEFDTWFGMAYSNFVALAIMVGCAATLHAHGVTTINTAEEAATALAPIAGHFATWIFALGIIGTGLLAIPTLAGSLAYALGEAFHWRTGLSLLPHEARTFYAAIAIATLLGVLIVFSPLSPMRALFWSAVVNGVAAAPMIVAMVVLASRADIMGDLVLPFWLRALGWLGAALMAGATVAMVAL
ncbi:MAG TPA: divalent metal cation transporter [Acetobacteraceae bacterium]|nr:divalent metal cation transporter [Acetobacteraceae bacterium]